MATINYRCNICKRTIDIVEKPYNLNVYSKCIITNGCKGKLNRQSRNSDNRRESIPSPVDGLDDYVQRKVLYSHTQNLINSNWKIKHNLGISPVVEVFVTSISDQKELKFSEYTVDIVDKNTINLKFSSPQTGIAQCIARSTVTSYDLIKSSNNKLFQVTFNGNFVFALPKLLTHFTLPATTPIPTLPLDISNTNKPIRIEISVLQPNQEEVICTENITTNIGTTPWIGWHEILLRKRRNYDTKIKSIFDFKKTLQSDIIKPKDISNGTQIRFLRIDYGTGTLQPIEQGDLILLLANNPHMPLDKITNKIIDANHVLYTNFNYFVYKDGEVYTAETNLEATYPNIQKVS